ncbi:hypothetical protein H9X54_004280 [Flavobacterium macrobrachii]|uniref:Uncharacterized protein n=1 Tax=Flavobacterium macrobrachii TaxID=591204 RepID=A0ABS2CU59_9FLAO|nr:hypothetical protein [Flavobacterium macrobrachii]MBM6498517.1 hypothetical protein [Flavobacterium macrobrachii]
MKYLIFLFFVSTTTLAQSSKDKTIYLDSLFFPTTKKEFKYYMIVEDYKNTKPEYFITIYYASGKIESKGYSKSKDFFKKKGEIISYYENETIKSTIFFEDNFPNGKCVLYFENGEKKMEGRYLLTTDIGGKRKSKLRIENAWNIDKLQVVTDGTGDYEEDEFFIVHNNNY